MKKLLIAIIASIMSLNAFAAVSYDFSSEEKLDASIAAQAKAEGVELEDAENLLALYASILTLQNAATVESLGEDNDAILSFILKTLEKEIQGKTLEEIAGQLEALAEKVEATLAPEKK